MDPKVRQWLEDADLPELVTVFEREKLTTFRRVLSLEGEHLKELIPQIGLRAHLSGCLEKLRQSDNVASPRSPSSSKPDLVCVEQSEHSDEGYNSPQIPERAAVSKGLMTLSATTPKSDRQPCSRKRKPETHDESPPPKHILSAKALESLRSQDFFNVFKDNIVTENVLMKYEQRGVLLDYDRGLIVDRAVQHLLQINPSPGLQELLLLSEKICEVFEHEKINTYFVPPNEQSKNPSGKVPHKVKNFRFNLRKRGNGVAVKFNFTAHANNSEVTTPAELEGSCDLEDDDILSSMIALKHQSTDSWPELLKHWSTTHRIRRMQLFENIEESDTGPRYLEVDEYFEKYPILKAANGSMLLCQDFAELYPGRENCLLALWENHRSLIISVLEEETPSHDKITLELLKAANEVEGDKQDTLLLALLPNLCMRKGRGNTAKKVPPIPVIRKSFLLHVKVPGDISREVRNYCSSLKEQNLKFQPILIAVGPTFSEISAWYVQIEETRYLFKTALAALDTCMKAFFALDIGYPSTSYGVWLFIQQYFFKIHLRSDETHPRENLNNHEGDNDNGIDNVEFEINLEHNFQNLHEHVNEPVDNEISVPDFKLALYKSSLALSAKLYSVPSINRSRVQSILDICSDFSCSAHLEVLETKVNCMLRNYDGPQQDLHDLREMFISMRDSFEGLRTERQRITALEQSNVYFPPKSFFIGRDWIMKKVNGVENRVLVELTGQYICMKSVLKNFFELPGMFTSTIENIEKLKRSNVFSNIIQGGLWKNIEDTYFQGRLVFPIVLYFDDAEPNNQTGSHSGDHSLGLLYYFIPCIPQHLLSLLENLFVAAVFLTNDKRRQNAETFRTVIDALKDLEREGIEINVGTETHRLFFAVVLIIGDNKGVNGITGFVESFSANFYCRICKQHRDESRIQTLENDNLLRNPDNYQEDVLLNDYSLTGIKSECVWNELVSYHCSVSCCLDLMHDYFEGVCHYDLAVVLKYVIERQFMSLETLNERVQYSNYGFDSGNKVTKITVEHLRKEKFKMSSSEMYFFVRHFGLMIGDLVPEGDVVWRLYILLSEIMDIVLSPTVRREAIPYLTTLISEHHQVYLNVSGKLLKPKFHFMTHTGRIMQQVGPLVHLWCMRLEGKHRPVVKAPANSHSCRKNMPLSTAMRYSFSLAARFLGMEVKPTVVFHFKSFVLREVDDFNNFQFIVPNNYYDALCVEMVTICGTMYRKNMVLAIGYDEDYPCFGVIFWIVKPLANDNQLSFFIVRGLATIGFNSHLHCYLVEHTNEWFFIEYNDLISFYPSQCRTGADGLCYVNYRHAL
ncbi:Eukaryotic translation initiation factor 3 subunit A [Frankliniella fusca]|uniref:Eukaryotic translation initiation factor 3 subunit A n=1 Tax=Frankliniella fusca TaxID=407009 RepID=A0AAE1LWX7_9NEOP|nr:Eukaryotic translation initiation factor 3 subunit A [Frankliniella fusca]